MAIKKKIEDKANKPSLKDYQIIKGPFITEKAASVGGDNYSGVVFEVDRKANKTEIKGAVERLFKVEVAGVRTCNYMGKVKQRGRVKGRASAYKKAYINLKPGFQIDLYEGI